MSQVNVNPNPNPNRRNLYLALAAAGLVVVLVALVFVGRRPGGFLNVNVNRQATPTPILVAEAPTALPTFTVAPTATPPPATPTGIPPTPTAVPPTPTALPTATLPAAAPPPPPAAPTAPAAPAAPTASVPLPPPPPPVPTVANSVPTAAAAVQTSVAQVPTALAEARATATVSLSPTPAAVAVAVVPGPGALALSAAQAQGYLADAGLSVDSAAVASDAVALPAVAAGQRAIGFGDPIQVMTQRQAVALIGPATVEGNGHWTHRYLVAASAGITTPKALEGKAVGISATGTVAEAAFRAWAAQHGVDASQVRLVAVPDANLASALQSGQVAMVDADSPWADQLATAGNTVLDAQPYAALGQSVVTGVWYGNRAWLDQHGQAARGLVAALGRGDDWLSQNPDRARQLLAQAANVPAAAAANATLPSTATVTPALLQPLIDAADRFQLLKASVRAGDLIATLR